MPLSIEVSNLTKVYPNGVRAVRGVTFDVTAGEVFGLLGPNGAGKSTTIGMLTTTVRPTSGTARVGGHDVVADPIGARSVSAVVFQDAVVDRTLTGRRNLQIHARLWGVARAEADRRIAATADQLGLGTLLDRPVSTYSGGQRRRLEIGRALLSEPSVLFLDEPTVGLDPRIRHELLDVIAQVRDDHDMTIVLTTHYLDEAERLCDRVAIVHDGAIVALGAPHALLAELGDQILELRVDRLAVDVVSLLQDHGVDVADALAVGSTLTLPLPEGRATGVLDAVAAAGVAVIASSSRPPTLDDVYLRLTGDRLVAAA